MSSRVHYYDGTTLLCRDTVASQRRDGSALCRKREGRGLLPFSRKRDNVMRASRKGQGMSGGIL